MITAALTSTKAEVKTVRARSGGVLIADTGSVEFPLQEAAELQILLEGESAAPGTPTGKSGTAEPVYSQKPTTFTIRAVDNDYNLVSGINDTVHISLSDSGAKVLESVDLVNGEATVTVTWRETGSQSIDVNNEPPPGEPEPTLFGFTSLVVETGLVVEDGETLTVDDEHYAVSTNIAAGSSVIPYDPSTWIMAGDEIFIITMAGEDIGAYEIHEVASVGTDSLTLSGALEQVFDGVNSKVMVQRIPNFGSAEVKNGGIITGHPWDGSTGGVVFFKAENLTVNAGGVIESTGLGFPVDEGPGAGFETRGASHGGFDGSLYNAPYGDALSPVQLGSGGGGLGNEPPEEGRGGGVLRIEVSGTLTHEGEINADGNTGYFGGGGGAGGSLWIVSRFSHRWGCDSEQWWERGSRN